MTDAGSAVALPLSDATIVALRRLERGGNLAAKTFFECWGEALQSTHPGCAGLVLKQADADALPQRVRRNLSLISRGAKPTSEEGDEMTEREAIKEAAAKNDVGTVLAEGAVPDVTTPAKRAAKPVRKEKRPMKTNAVKKTETKTKTVKPATKKPKLKAVDGGKKEKAKVIKRGGDGTYSDTVAGFIQQRLVEGKKSHDEIFAEVQEKYELPDTKRWYISWYRHYLKKKGVALPDAPRAARTPKAAAKAGTKVKAKTTAKRTTKK